LQQQIVNSHFSGCGFLPSCFSWCLGGVLAGYRGQVTFGGLPVPGATVKATWGSKQFATTTDQQGFFSFPDLADGKWTIEVRMTGFAIVKQEVVIGAKAPAGKWELKLLPLDQIKTETSAPGVGSRHPVAQSLRPAAQSRLLATGRAAGHGVPLRPVPGGGRVAAQGTSEQPNPAGGETLEIAPSEEDLSQRAADGFLINGSVLNGAASPFAQPSAFGNYRNAAKGLCND
jgi:hypothetical protein